LPPDNAPVLEAVKDAPGDRERVDLVMDAVYELFSADAERGIKLLRDALPMFQARSALDRPMARVIREGRPTDDVLPRLRRILERDHEGRNFTASLQALGSREHPEPWKQVLGQLKLKES